MWGVKIHAPAGCTRSLYNHARAARQRCTTSPASELSATSTTTPLPCSSSRAPSAAPTTSPGAFAARSLGNHGSTLLAAASTTTPLPLLPLPVRASSVPIESSREERHSSKEEEEEQARAAILAAASASSAASLSRRGSADSSCACLQASAEATDGWTQLL